MPNNYSIHSITAAYALGLAPHGYYFIKMMANAKGQASNILYVRHLQSKEPSNPSDREKTSRT